MHYWLAVLAYILPTFPLGYFWHLRTFAPAYEALEIYRPAPMIPMGLASMLIQALIFAGLYPRLFDTAAWADSALAFFLTFAPLSWSFQVLPVAAKNRMTSPARFLALETGFTLLHFAIVSPLIALAWRS
jgi:hypothetical protein